MTYLVVLYSNTRSGTTRMHIRIYTAYSILFPSRTMRTMSSTTGVVSRISKQNPRANVVALRITWTMTKSFYMDQYFTELTTRKLVFYLLVVIIVLLVTLVSLVEPFLSPAVMNCGIEGTSKTFANSLFVYDPCRYQRYAVLLFLTPDECSFARRLIISVLLGGVVGWERREADRPAGIRTMSLVSLGSCLFTINSAFAFLDGPMEWDSSRISAAIPSGVGFLGAGLIFKEAEKDEKGSITHVVHGLTTSASLWLSSAVGVACGGGLYFAASYCVALMLVLLRFGPRATFAEDDHPPPVEAAIERTSIRPEGLSPTKYSSITIPEGAADQAPDDQSEASSLLADNSNARASMKLSVRRRANLGSLV
jgi:putative Mg2+ transporter-C (MgtC) family protein